MGRKKNGADGKITKLGYVSDAQIASHLSRVHRIPMIDLADYVIQADVVALVPKALCEEHTVMPVSRVGPSLIVAMADPTNQRAIDALKRHGGYSIEPVIATEVEILKAIATYFAPD